MKLGMALLCGVGFSGMANASNALMSRLEAAVTRGLPAAKRSEVVAPNCTNLSGRWAGTCVNRKDATDTYQDEVKIVQKSCKSIEVDGFAVNPVKASKWTASLYRFQDFRHFK